LELARLAEERELEGALLEQPGHHHILRQEHNRRCPTF